MEPIFAASTNQAVTAQLLAQLETAVPAIPPAYRLRPSRNCYDLRQRTDRWMDGSCLNRDPPASSRPKSLHAEPRIP